MIATPSTTGNRTKVEQHRTGAPMTSSDTTGIYEVTSSNDTTEKEVMKYFADGSNSLHSLRQYPGVLRVFMKFNTPLPSSSPVERVFSLAGHIHALQRNRLSDQIFGPFRI
jgi:hypothetical protein